MSIYHCRVYVIDDLVCMQYVSFGHTLTSIHSITYNAASNTCDVSHILEYVIGIQRRTHYKLEYLHATRCLASYRLYITYEHRCFRCYLFQYAISHITYITPDILFNHSTDNTMAIPCSSMYQYGTTMIPPEPNTNYGV